MRIFSFRHPNPRPEDSPETVEDQAVTPALTPELRLFILKAYSGSDIRPPEAFNPEIQEMSELIIGELLLGRYLQLSTVDTTDLAMINAEAARKLDEEFAAIGATLRFGLHLRDSGQDPADLEERIALQAAQGLTPLPELRAAS